MLTNREIEEATSRLVKLIQHNYFKGELNCLQEEGGTMKSSSLRALNPFLDCEGILRVGGRLKNSELSFTAKHPIILPCKHSFSTQLIRYYHLKYLHSGMSLTLNMIRQKYWLTGNARSLVRKIIRGCVKCRRFSGPNVTPLMGDLPSHRVRPSHTFSSTGVDYAGPIGIKQSFGRSRNVIKSYIAIFVCFATKAVHIELVLDLSSEAFLAALRRFISRRGSPSHLYSDNATTFVGANSRLREWYKALKDNQAVINNFCLENEISWHFIPSRAPHMGGLWEAAVKSMKHHLIRVIGDTVLSFDQFYTLLVRIESCLNSRPIVPLSNDPEDLDALTPNHFLFGYGFAALPDTLNVNLTRNHLTSRWQRIQECLVNFWKRWSLEYLNNLQQRNKWRIERRNLRPQELVIIREDNLAPQRWLLGRVLETFPGADGEVRVVSVKTKNGCVKRPVVKLVPLLDEPDEAGF